MFYYLSLGANLGDRKSNISKACCLIEQRVGHILRRSSDYFSQPWGYQSDHEYLNVCLLVSSPMTPIEMLRATQDIEFELGRTVKNVYQDRTIDIDIIMCLDNDHVPIVVNLPDLTIPHPRMKERDFVMIPLSEILYKE